MTGFKVVVSVCGLIGLLGGTASAVNIETVPVGNPGNAGELSGASAWYGYGPDRICGSVDYTYNIGKHEVTAGEYRDFLNAVAKTDTYGLYNTNMWSNSYGCRIEQTGVPGNYSYSVAPDSVNRPVTDVSWGDAARFANWLHNNQPTGPQDSTTTEDGAYFLNGVTSNEDLLVVNRKSNWKWAITSEDEWYKAAYHKGGSTNAGYFDYPTGNDTAPGRDVADASGNNANYFTTASAFTGTTAVGEFQNSDSPYGTFDQGGNAWEWNEAALDGSSRGTRGGSITSYDDSLLASGRYGVGPTNEGNNLGFRVVQLPEPATMVMLALASVGTLRRRKA